MATNPYRSLGWNPVPGIPGEVHALQQKVSQAATSLRNCHHQLQRLSGESSYWQGDAAKNFREALDGDLSTYVKNAARSLEKAAAQLQTWDDDLTSNRDLARRYDEEAGERKAAAEKARQRYGQAKEHPDLTLANQQFPTQAEADAAEQRLRTAERSLNEATTALNSANDAYSDVIRKAETLEHAHTDQADLVAKSLDEATDKLAPREPGWLSKAVNGIWEAIKAVGQFLYDHAGTIGAIAGLLALIPGPWSPVFAGIALVASMVSMTHNLADPEFRSALWGDKFGWNMDTFSAYGSLAGDTLGMVPGVGALGRAGKEVAEAARMAEGFGETVSTGAKVTEFAKDIVPAFTRSHTDDLAAAVADAAAGGAARVKRVTDFGMNSVNVVANLASSAETFGWLPEDGAGHNTAETTKAAATLHGIAGLVGLA
ncbi:MULTISPECIES: WXG100 family type VII secretion target, partial [Streptomyces]|uniref:Putative T7SS secretion signal domain-containing protein n=1 Tax=Streptomyces pseudovenezuelae TaxID=67350 RepID=A0A117PQ53_9ACTN